jgi:hypothetical protein
MEAVTIRRIGWNLFSRFLPDRPAVHESLTQGGRLSAGRTGTAAASCRKPQKGAGKVIRKLGIYLMCLAVTGLTAGCASMTPEREQACLIGAGLGAAAGGGIAAIAIANGRRSGSRRRRRAGGRAHRMSLGERSAAAPAASTSTTAAASATSGPCTREDNSARRAL